MARKRQANVWVCKIAMAHVTIWSHPSPGMATDMPKFLAVVALCWTNGVNATRGSAWGKRCGIGEGIWCKVIKGTETLIVIVV